MFVTLLEGHVAATGRCFMDPFGQRLFNNQTPLPKAHKASEIAESRKKHTRHPSKSRPRNPNPPLKKDGIMPQNPRTPGTSRNGFIPDMLRPSLFFSAYSLISMIALHGLKGPSKSPLCYRLVICWWLFPSVALIRLDPSPNSPTSSELPAGRRCQLGGWEHETKL